MLIQPPSTLIIGAPGAGKTDSLATATEAGLKLFVIITEPGGVESLIDSHVRRRLPLDNVHWATCLPANAGWEALKSMTNTIGTMSYQSIQDIKNGVGKSETLPPAQKLLGNLVDFHCERTGERYGDFSKWTDDSCLGMDSLTGLSTMSMDLTIGYKPAAHQGEWGVAMNFVEKVLQKIASDRKCFYILTAHMEKETNEITGAQQIMASTLGRKLAPKIPRFFSEVVMAKRGLSMVNGKQVPKFTWATVDGVADLKSRSLPIGSDLDPSFRPVVDAYRNRLKTVEATMQSSTPPKPLAIAAPKPGVVVPPAAPMGRAAS